MKFNYGNLLQIPTTLLTVTYGQHCCNDGWVCMCVPLGSILVVVDVVLRVPSIIHN